MTLRQRLAAMSLLALTVASCGSGQPHNVTAANVARSGPVTPAPAPTAPAPANISKPAAPAPAADPGLADLSPAQRRAYDLGYRDCSRGRYAPDNHLEAYRIGCGAAHDRAGAARPQG